MVPRRGARGDAAAGTWICRGYMPRRGARGDAAAATWIYAVERSSRRRHCWDVDICRGDESRGGLDVDEARARRYNGVDIYGAHAPIVGAKVAAYIGQIDEHAPSLTVRETLEFAYKMGSPKEQPQFHGDSDADEALRDYMTHRPTFVMRAFGIDHVADTVVGDANMRGVSGGQRRRVTVAEMCLGQQRLIFGDEITTGLDSRTAFEITNAMSMAAKYTTAERTILFIDPSRGCRASAQRRKNQSRLARPAGTSASPTSCRYCSLPRKSTCASTT